MRASPPAQMLGHARNNGLSEQFTKDGTTIAQLILLIREMDAGTR